MNRSHSHTALFPDSPIMFILRSLILVSMIICIELLAVGSRAAVNISRGGSSQPLNYHKKQQQERRRKADKQHLQTTSQVPGLGDYRQSVLPPPKPKKYYPFGIKFNEASAKQYFFLVPAHFGGTIFTAISAFVCWPISAGWNYYHGHRTRRDLIPPVPWASQTIGMAGAYLFGSPFWALEKAFWDFPIWLFSDDQPEEKPYHYEYPLGSDI